MGNKGKKTNKKKKKGGVGGGGGRKVQGGGGCGRRHHGEAAAAGKAAPDGKDLNGTSPLSPAEKEEALLEELRVRTRSLLASMKGVVPDGAPFFAAASSSSSGGGERQRRPQQHSLAMLYESVMTLTEKLISLQRSRARSEEEEKKTAEEESGEVREGGAEGEKTEGSSSSSGGGGADDHRDDAKVWERFDEWLTLCDIEPKKRGFPVEIRKTTSPSPPDGQSGSGSWSGSSGYGYGLFATRDIDYGETVLEIPVPTMLCPYFDHCLTNNNKEEKNFTTPPPPPPFDPTRSREQDEQMKPLCLVMLIVNERWKGRRSSVRPYLDTLPRVYSTPLYWSSESILDLKHTDHLKRAVQLQMITLWEYLQMRDLLKRAHAERMAAAKAKAKAKKKGGGDDAETMGGDLIPVECFTYELFRWATAAAHTRQNLIPYFERSSSSLCCGKEEEESSVKPPAKGSRAEDVVRQAYGLVPLWDLINHEDSDRACRSDVSMIEEEDPPGSSSSDDPENAEEGGGGANAAAAPRQGVLFCRTPVRSPLSDAGEEERSEKEDDNASPPRPPSPSPCFRKGEEIKMYYGDRSSAQLLFHSGFVHGGRRRRCAPAGAAAGEGEGEGEGGDGTNRNRNDRAVLRLSLPNAECEPGLDRVREMLAARFGFAAYGDQGVTAVGDSRGGMAALAGAAAEILLEEDGRVRGGGDGGKDGDGGDGGRRGYETSRKEGEVLTIDLSVSPSDDEACSDELKRALLLCLADRNELAHLLRNVDRYVTPTSPSSSTKNNNGDNLLELGEKHRKLVSKIVEVAKGRYAEAARHFGDDGSAGDGAPSSCPEEPSLTEDGIWLDRKYTRRLVEDLSYCDRITLERWHDKFISSFYKFHTAKQ